MNDQLFHIFDNQDWREISSRLIQYASMKAKRLYWRTGNPANLPRGISPEDIAQEAIKKVLSCERNWNPDKVPDLLKFLQGVVDSDINHLAESWDNRYLKNTPDDELEAVMQTNCANGLNKPPETPEEAVLAEENEEQVLSMITDALNGDEELNILVDALMGGYEKPQEIAKITGMDIKLVYQLKRKLKRKLKRHLQKVRLVEGGQDG